MSIKLATANIYVWAMQNHAKVFVTRLPGSSRFGHATHLIRGLGGSHDAKEITKLLGLAGCLGKTESKKAKTDQELE